VGEQKFLIGFFGGGRGELGFSCANGGLMGDQFKIHFLLQKDFFMGFFLWGEFFGFFCFVYAKMAFM
jgi:hypothetical protein